MTDAERIGSSHDHGNCELCDEQETRLAALTAEVERLNGRLAASFDAVNKLEGRYADAVHTLARRDAELAGVVEAAGDLLSRNVLSIFDSERRPLYPEFIGVGRLDYEHLRAALPHVQSRAEASTSVIAAATRRYELRYSPPDSPEVYAADQALFDAVARLAREGT